MKIYSSYSITHTFHKSLLVKTFPLKCFLCKNVIIINFVGIIFVAESKLRHFLPTICFTGKVFSLFYLPLYYDVRVYKYINTFTNI